MYGRKILVQHLVIIHCCYVTDKNEDLELLLTKNNVESLLGAKLQFGPVYIYWRNFSKVTLLI